MSRSNTSSSPPVSEVDTEASLFTAIAQASPIKPANKAKRERERQAQDDDEIEVLGTQESDVECWLRMLALQREFHCYNSARLEAAVEALERGCSIEEVSIREFVLSWSLFE